MIWHHDSNFSLQDWASARQWEETRWDEKELKMKTEMRQELMWWSTDETEINLSHIWVKSEQNVWVRFWQDLKDETKRDAF